MCACSPKDMLVLIFRSLRTRPGCRRTFCSFCRSLKRKSIFGIDCPHLSASLKLEEFFRNPRVSIEQKIEQHRYVCGWIEDRLNASASAAAAVRAQDPQVLPPADLLRKHQAAEQTIQLPPAPAVVVAPQPQLTLPPAPIVASQPALPPPPKMDYAQSPQQQEQKQQQEQPVALPMAPILPPAPEAVLPRAPVVQPQPQLQPQPQQPAVLLPPAPPVRPQVQAEPPQQQPQHLQAAEAPVNPALWVAKDHKSTAMCSWPADR